MNEEVDQIIDDDADPSTIIDMDDDTFEDYDVDTTLQQQPYETDDHYLLVSNNQLMCLLSAINKFCKDCGSDAKLKTSFCGSAFLVKWVCARSFYFLLCL